MLRGLVVGTIPLTVICFVVGMLIALAAALARMSANPLLRNPARFYISVIRGTPLLVQLFIVFYGLPQIGLKIPSYPAAIIALSLNVGGYAAEIIRSSILSVPRGQFEAATTIGMPYAQSMRRIILPQAARIAVPPLSNTLLSLIKDTSLASVVLVPELLHEAQIAAASSQQYLPLYIFAALYYWVVCWLVSLGTEPAGRTTREVRGMTTTPTDHPGSSQLLIEVDGLAKAFGDQQVLQRHRLHRRGGHGDRAARSLRFGQDDRAAFPQRARDARRRHGANRATRRSTSTPCRRTRQLRRREIAALRSRSGMVFQSHNLFPHKTVLENLNEGPVQVQGRDAGRGNRRCPAAPRAGRSGRSRGRLPGTALRWTAAAGRHRPGACAQAAGGAARRADVRAGPRAGRRGARRDQGPGPAGLDADDRHPRGPVRARRRRPGALPRRGSGGRARWTRGADPIRSTIAPSSSSAGSWRPAERRTACHASRSATSSITSSASSSRCSGITSEGRKRSTLP